MEPGLQYEPVFALEKSLFQAVSEYAKSSGATRALALLAAKTAIGEVEFADNGDRHDDGGDGEGTHGAELASSNAGDGDDGARQAFAPAVPFEEAGTRPAYVPEIVPPITVPAEEKPAEEAQSASGGGEEKEDDTTKEASW